MGISGLVWTAINRGTASALQYQTGSAAFVASRRRASTIDGEKKQNIKLKPHFENSKNGIIVFLMFDSRVLPILFSQATNLFFQRKRARMEVNPRSKLIHVLLDSPFFDYQNTRQDMLYNNNKTPRPVG